ncbi:MAG: MotA/TolQ/ExbB proton channel family protein [Proteobacteria bacterium]|nr:MotA/TolQ/ExbB proton channel family protein [Pseudomonadota bacterium]
MIEFFTKGGIFMYPILICSIMSLWFFIYKLLILKKDKNIPPNLVNEAKRLIIEGKFEDIYKVCVKYPSPLAKILIVISKNLDKDRGTIKELVEIAGKTEVIELEKYIEAIGTIAGISTLLGLLGTISGLISIFSTISIDPVVNPARLAGGISEALNTTAFGLVVAIPSLAFNKYLESKVNKIVAELEQVSAEFIDLISKES